MSHDAFPESRRPALSPYLPSAAGAVYHLPSRPHTDPSGRPTCKTERHRNYRGPGGGQGAAGFLSFPQLPPFLLSSGFVRVLPGFTLLHRHFVCSSHAPDTVPHPGPHRGGRKEKVGGKRGQSWEVARGCCTPCSVEAVGAGEVLQEYPCKLNKSSELPCRSGLSRRVV